MKCFFKEFILIFIQQTNQFIMKNKIVLVLVMSFFLGSVNAQNSSIKINIGDIFIVGEVENNDYKHINFPKDNIIIKKGGIVNYDNIKGSKVEVTSMKTKKDGTQIATVKLTNGKLFFNSHKYLTVDVKKAIEEKEFLNN